jgi:hypothetical protein
MLSADMRASVRCALSLDSALALWSAGRQARGESTMHKARHVIMRIAVFAVTCVRRDIGSDCAMSIAS